MASEESEVPVYLGHYRVEKTLGQGSYGKVKLATNTKTNQKVIIEKHGSFFHYTYPYMLGCLEIYFKI